MNYKLGTMNYKLLKQYQIQVVEERNELLKKTNLLNVFVNYSSVFKTLNVEEQERMKFQLNVMLQYVGVLSERIVSFSKEIV